MGPSISSIQDIFISSPYHQRPENQCNNMCDAHYITKNEPTNNLNDVAPFFLFLARNSFRQVPMRDQKGIKTNNGKVSLISNTAWFPSQPTIKHSSKHGRFAYNLPNGFSFRECFFFFFSFMAQIYVLVPCSIYLCRKDSARLYTCMMANGKKKMFLGCGK